jgi:hypothetical protein
MRCSIAAFLAFFFFVFGQAFQGYPFPPSLSLIFNCISGLSFGFLVIQWLYATKIAWDHEQASTGEATAAGAAGASSVPEPEIAMQRGVVGGTQFNNQQMPQQQYPQQGGMQFQQQMPQQQMPQQQMPQQQYPQQGGMQFQQQMPQQQMPQQQYPQQGGMQFQQQMPQQQMPMAMAYAIPQSAMGNASSEAPPLPPPNEYSGKQDVGDLPLFDHDKGGGN